MKTNKTKITLAAALLVIGVGVCGNTAVAQLGNIKGNIKNPIGGGNGNSTTSATTTTTDEGTTGTTGGAANPGWYQVTEPTVVFSNDYGFSTTKTSFEPGENIFVRFAFPKSIGETFKDLMGMSDVPSTGKVSLAISKNFDTEPIILNMRDLFTSRYSNDNVIDFTLQSDQETIEKIGNGTGDVAQKVCFNSQSTMGTIGLNDEWLRQAGLMPISSGDWEVFLLFSPWNSEDPEAIKLAAQGKFTYTITADNKSKLASGMNFYDKQGYEKTPDDGVVTGVHKANLEKIAFSKSKMTKTFDDASALTTTFSTLAGGVYGRLYLKESMRNILAIYGNGKDVGGASYRMNFFVDGKTDYSCYADAEMNQDDALNRTSWSVPLAPLNQEDYDYDPTCVNRFAYVISELPAGTHKIKLKCMFQVDNDPMTEICIAEGEFSITIAIPDRDAFVKKYGLQLPSKGLLETDTKLAAEVKAIAGDVIAVRCPNSWENKTDAFGQITHRVAPVVYSYKDESGRCKMSVFMIKQVKNSSGWDATTACADSPWYGVDPYLPFQNSK